MAGCPSSHQPTRIREETLESGGPLQRKLNFRLHTICRLANKKGNARTSAGGSTSRQPSMPPSLLANLHTVKSCIHNFVTSFLFQRYSLEKYRSKEEKLELLDEAIATFDGGTITTVRNSDSEPCYILPISRSIRH